MSNTRPNVPDLSCPVEPTPLDTYYNDQQSHLNVARQDKFILVMDIPEVLKPYIRANNGRCHGGNVDKLQLSIWGFVVPELQVGKFDVGYSGQVLQFSNLSRPAMPPININFTVDNTFDNYYVLYKWLDLQNDAQYSQYDAGRMNPNSQGHLPEYSSTFTVYAIDEYKKYTAKWVYTDAFPTILGGINANSRQDNELEASFTFVFSQIKMDLV